MTSTHAYTCNSCQIAFRNSDLQRGHMRSDWHRYNLKRRITSLHPISLEVFTEKALQAQAQTTAAATKSAFEKTCVACERTYFSENTFLNHLGSQRHKNKIASVRSNEIENLSIMSSTFSLGDPLNCNENVELRKDETGDLNQAIQMIGLGDQIPMSRWTSQIQKATSIQDDKDILPTSAQTDDQVKTEDVNLKRCLFCNSESLTMGLNVTHMQKSHGMFVPERQYLVDLEGLISYLYQKIHDYHQCLCCGKLKPTIFGLQTHMRDKGHCNIPYGTEEEQLEIGEYYDFTSTYSDDEDNTGSPVSRSSMPSKSTTRSVSKSHTENNKSVDLDECWETDDSESTVSSSHVEQLTCKQRAHKDQKFDEMTKMQAKSNRRAGQGDQDSLDTKHSYSSFYSDYELYLPTGRIAGHRLMNKYFKQNLHHYPSIVEREERLFISSAASQEEEESGRVSNGRHDQIHSKGSVSRAHGGLGMIGVCAEKKKEVIALEKCSRKMEERGRRRNEWRINKQNNSQKHFRDPLLQ